MSVKLLTEHHLEFLSLKGGCRGSSEYTHVKMPYCWKSHATAHLLCWYLPQMQLVMAETNILVNVQSCYILFQTSVNPVLAHIFENLILYSFYDNTASNK